MIAAGASGVIGVIWIGIAVDRVLIEVLRDEWAAFIVAALFLTPPAILLARHRKKKKLQAPTIESVRPLPAPAPLFLRPAGVNSVNALATLVVGRILIDQFPRTSTLIRRWLSPPP
jgi:hypothetical protein